MKTLFLSILLVVIAFTGYGVAVGSLVLISPKNRIHWDREDYELWTKLVIVFLACICGLIMVLKMP